MTSSPELPGGVLAEAVDRLWAIFGGRDSLLPSLPFDAVAARARHGELRTVTPRLLELAMQGETGGQAVHEPFRLLGTGGWQGWPEPERRAVEAAADAWWALTLDIDDPDPTVDVVLASVVQLDLPMVRWLGPWLDALDGPAARHLARFVIDGPTDPGWEASEDHAGQVLAWARTEPVLFGLTLVGGVHLDDGMLGEALDVLLGS